MPSATTRSNDSGSTGSSLAAPNARNNVVRIFIKTQRCAGIACRNCLQPHDHRSHQQEGHLRRVGENLVWRTLNAVSSPPRRRVSARGFVNKSDALTAFRAPGLMAQPTAHGEYAR